MGIYIHAPDLGELGSFGYDIDAALLAKWEDELATRYMIATTVPYQAPTERVLRASGWQDAGHRYNQYHGPHFVTLWFKEREGAKPRAPRKLEGRGYGGWIGFNPPNSAFSCGLFVVPKPDFQVERTLETKWLAVWRFNERPDRALRIALKANGWKALAPTIYTTAEPHDVRNKHKAE